MNDLVALQDFLVAIGYSTKNLSFSEGVDLLTNVKSVISNRLGLPANVKKIETTSVGVSRAMDGEVLRSCDLPINNPANFDGFIVETPLHLVQ